ncbi:flagellar filament capping protein FliD [Pseudomonas sp. MOB-449]|nr:flagellar filament capping protein FliD [Pseudomonas sp. MOB-449]
MASTTINGYNSGLDINSIISSMVAAEKAPKEAQLKRLESASTAKISGIGQLKSAIADLQSALKELNKPELFEKRTAVSSDTKLISASTTKEALSGIYKIDVERLATASKVATASVSGGSDFAFAQGGSLKISLGSSQLKDVNIADGATLKEVRDAINTQLKDDGVSASIVTDPATNTSKLVLSSSKTGSGNDLTMVANVGSSLAALDVPAYDAQNPAPGVSYISMSSNAKFSIDGLELESATNSVDKAIEGVTFELLGKTEPDKPITLTIDQDKSGVQSNIGKFVDAYNKLMKVTKELTGVTQVGEGKAPVTGALVGDASVRTLLSAVRNELVSPSGEEGIRILADLGVTTQKDGTLKVDSDKLTKALDENFESVSSFFTGDTGLMTRLDGKLEPYTRTGGILEQRVSGLQETITSVDNQREALNRRVTAMQERLLKQFTAMDSLIGQLNQTSGRLSQTLASLPGVSNS